MHEPRGHPGGLAVAADEPVHGDRGDGERLLIAVTAETHEQRPLVEQHDAVGERMDRRPRLERMLYGLGEQVAASSPGRAGGRAGGEGADARDELGVDELELGIHRLRGRPLQLAHDERLFPKTSMSGQAKPRIGRLHARIPQDGGGPLT